MKKIAVITAAVLSACVAQPVVAAPASEKDLCNSIESLARQVMRARQAGVPLSAVLSAGDPDNPAKEMVRSMAMIAYGGPRYSTEEYKQREIDEFANKFAHMCYNRKSK